MHPPNANPQSHASSRLVSKNSSGPTEPNPALVMNAAQPHASPLSSLDRATAPQAGNPLHPHPQPVVRSGGGDDDGDDDDDDDDVLSVEEVLGWMGWRGVKPD
ncbi:hypothetical protein GX51_04667 [Blastomyces parvus]|uniref:Uncharacterized protein n=1 Tax=Blastomyces parvus TaxID=2060905 RepID=A0A2B7X0F3_9EURO|nr:hypothetical protein GX51_04667 [Blastomyces parvus]